MAKDLPYFIEKAQQHPTRKNLEQAVDASILIVGGGMAGISTAYALSAKIDPTGITLVDSGRIGLSTTGRSAGLLVDSVEEDYCDTEREEFDQIEKGILGIVGAVEREKLNCALTRMPSLYLATDNEEQISNIRREFEARKKDGFDVELLGQEQLKNRYGIAMFGAMKNKEGFCLDPAAFCLDMAEVLEKRGVRIFEQTKVIRYDEKRRIALTPLGVIKYQKLVLTNSSPSSENNFTDRALLLSTVAAVTEPLSQEQYKQTFPNGEYMGWDAAEKDYLYFRPVGEDRLLIGGLDRLVSLRAAKRNPTGSRVKDKQEIRKLFEKMFPHLNEIPFSHIWGGIIPSSIDNIPFVGEYKPDHYVGLYNPGLPHSFNCGRILSQFVLEEAPETCLLNHDRRISFANKIRALTKYEPFTALANKFYFS